MVADSPHRAVAASSDKPAPKTAQDADQRRRDPHRLHPLAAEPALRDPPRLPDRLGRRSGRQGGGGVAHRRDARTRRQQAPHLRRAARRALSAGRRDQGLQRQGIGGVRRDRPPRQPGEVRRSARRAGADPPLRRRRLRPQQGRRARLPDQDAARERRRGARQAGAGDGALPGAPLRPPHAGDGRRAHRHHARRREEVLRRALRAQPAGGRRRGRLPGRLRRGVRQAVLRAAGQGAAAAQAAAGAGAQGQPAPGRAEGRARQRHLHRPHPRRHPQGRRLLSAHRGAVVPRRAPHLQRRADEPPARQPRPQLRRLRLHRELHPGRLDHVPAPQHSRAGSSTSRSGCARSRRRTACSRCAPRSTRPTS